jgi:NAD(P)-dependent dehydrogenase (short-subunit alcohol dehydrogenase family)
MTMGTFDGKVVLVTGASSGIGEASARRFAAEGATVVLADRTEDGGKAVEKDICASGGSASFVRTDVTRLAEVKSLVDQIVDRYDRLDCALNAAGIAGPVMVPLADVEEDQWDDVMNTNLKAVWLCMKFEIPAMLRHGGGSIVNISSAYGLKPSDLGHAPYCASKHGVVGLTKTAAIDYAADGIRVNAIAPGFTHSGMVDPYVAEAPELIGQAVARHSAVNRLGEADEQAAAITWLASDAASFVSGAVLAVDGGGTSRLY